MTSESGTLCALPKVMNHEKMNISSAKTGGRAAVLLLLGGLGLAVAALVSLERAAQDELVPSSTAALERYPQSFQEEKLVILEPDQPEQEEQAQRIRRAKARVPAEEVSLPNSLPNSLPGTSLPSLEQRSARRNVSVEAFRHTIDSWRGPDVCAKRVPSATPSTIKLSLKIGPSGRVKDTKTRDVDGPLEAALASCLAKQTAHLAFPARPGRAPVEREATFVF